MALFAAVLGLAFIAPFFAVMLPGSRRTSLPSPTRAAVIRRAALAGSLGIVPIGFLITLGAYGDWIVLLLFCVVGGLYGALIGVTITWLRGFRHRDRTG